MLGGTYKGGNVAEIIATRAFSACGDELGYTTILATMTELRELMDKLEAEYKAKSCCPSCGTLTLDGRTCADCLRYAESKYTGPCDCGVCMECVQCGIDNNAEAVYDDVAYTMDAALMALLEQISER